MNYYKNITSHVFLYLAYFEMSSNNGFSSRRQKCKTDFHFCSHSRNNDCKSAYNNTSILVTQDIKISLRFYLYLENEIMNIDNIFIDIIKLLNVYCLFKEVNSNHVTYNDKLDILINKIQSFKKKNLDILKELYHVKFGNNDSFVIPNDIECIDINNLFSTGNGKSYWATNILSSAILLGHSSKQLRDILIRENDVIYVYLKGNFENISSCNLAFIGKNFKSCRSIVQNIRTNIILCSMLIIKKSLDLRYLIDKELIKQEYRLYDTDNDSSHMTHIMNSLELTKLMIEFMTNN